MRALAMLICVFLPSCGSDQPDPIQLSLKEVARLRLDPAVGPPTGVFIADAGTLVVWTNNRVLEATRGVRELSPVLLNQVVNPVAVWINRDSLVVVDGLAQARFVFAPVEEVMERVGWSEPVEVLRLADRFVPGRIMGASAVDCGTLVARLDTTGVLRIDLLRKGSATDGVPGPWEQFDDETGDMWSVGAGRGSMLLGRTSRPFQTFEVGCNGWEAVLAAPKSLEVLTHDGEWRSRSPVVSDAFAIRTISDVTSDRRVLIVYDDAGRELRNTTVEAPFGIAGVDPGGRWVVGIQTLDGPEVILYSADVR